MGRAREPESESGTWPAWIDRVARPHAEESEAAEAAPCAQRIRCTATRERTTGRNPGSGVTGPSGSVTQRV